MDGPAEDSSVDDISKSKEDLRQASLALAKAVRASYVSFFLIFVTFSQLQYEARSRLLLESAAISIESACVAHEEYIDVNILSSHECRV